MTLLETLGIDLPIIQAPMAGVSSPELAAAVSNAGALGSIGVGAVDASWLDYLRPHFARSDAAPPREIHEIYKSFVADDAMLAALAGDRPRIVRFHCRARV
jgi:nitronate monooxygenase